MKFDAFYKIFKLCYIPLVGLSIVFFLLNATKLHWIDDLIPFGIMLFLGLFSLALYRTGAAIFADEEGIDIGHR